jgi:hypothetical protein
MKSHRLFGFVENLLCLCGIFHLELYIPVLCNTEKCRNVKKIRTTHKSEVFSSNYSEMHNSFIHSFIHSFS